MSFTPEFIVNQIRSNLNANSGTINNLFGAMYNKDEVFFGFNPSINYLNVTSRNITLSSWNLNVKGLPNGGSAQNILTVDGSGRVLFRTPAQVLTDIGASTTGGSLGGSGTANYIPKWTGASNIGNSVIFENSTNIGIGTTSPLSKLHVVNSSTAESSISLGLGNRIYSTTPSNNGQASLIAKGNGGDFRLQIQDGNGRVNMYWNAYIDGGYKYIGGNESAIRYLMNSSATVREHAWYVAPTSINAGDSITWTQLGSLADSTVWFSPRGTSSDFCILSSGNIGVGTTTPSTIFNVVGDGVGVQGQFEAYGTTPQAGIICRKANGTATSPVAVSDGQRFAYFVGGTYGTTVFANPAAINFTASQNHTDSARGSYITFDTTAINQSSRTEKMRITSSGNIGIGTASPAYQLQLSTDSAAKPSTNTWTVASDERLKNDISLADIDRCYEIIKTLPLKRYTWKEEIYSYEQVSDRSKIGWIAQDVQTVFPKGVDTKTATFAPNGSASEVVIEDCLSLNADQIYAAMYGAIQKLIVIIETQTQTISALENRIQTLENTQIA